VKNYNAILNLSTLIQLGEKSVRYLITKENNSKVSNSAKPIYRENTNFMQLLRS